MELADLSISCTGDWEGKVSGQATDSESLVSAMKEAARNNTCAVMSMCVVTTSGYCRPIAGVKWKALSLYSAGLESRLQFANF
jgi:hypothetical protein